MEPFEIVMTIINTIAVVAIPIVSVVVAHHLQNRAEKRKDKLNVFKTLMMSRSEKGRLAPVPSLPSIA